MPYAIITGGSTGIGKAIAEQLLHSGYSVAICGRNKERLAATENQWNEQFPGASVIAYCADVSVPENAQSFIDEVSAVFPETDVLVNNAGSFQPGNIADEPADRLQMMMAANLYSAYYITRAVLPAMIRKGSGHIFNICSVASLRAYPNGGSYSIAKYALLGFSDNLREEVRKHNIKVTSVCPGATYTASWEGSGVEPARMMEAGDIARTVMAAVTLSPQAAIEQIVMRPVTGDL